MPRSRWVLGVAAALAMAVLAAGAGWWFFVREDAQLATSAPVIPDNVSATPTPGPSASVDPLPAGTEQYAIVSEQSEAAYFADEKLASLPLPSTAKGSTKAITGEFYLTAEGLDSSRPSVFTVDLRTLRSDESRRDSRVQSQGLETSKYPMATFTATAVEGWPADFAEGEEVEFRLTGILDLHGVEREVTWDVKARKEASAFSALATVTFKYTDFDIRQLNIANFVSVAEEVTLQVSIIAVAA